MKLPNEQLLIQILAHNCHYAQEHVNCPDAWPTGPIARSDYFECVSYQVACYLSQNTVNGGEGVEWEVVHDRLCEYPMKPVAEWEHIISLLVEEYGGFQDGPSLQDAELQARVARFVAIPHHELKAALAECQKATGETYFVRPRNARCAVWDIVDVLGAGGPHGDTPNGGCGIGAATAVKAQLAADWRNEQLKQQWDRQKGAGRTRNARRKP